MDYIYTVEVHYDFETNFVIGIFLTESEAEKVADEYRNSKEVLDGVSVRKERVFNSYEEWDKYNEVD